ncbi:hypothetical protein PZ938_04295 [Luteipulveratus sp. YIM 133132]|uniref:hypothetical protein n=1 Tax=Luteipulveratus flavus TaxID=3031728 RepID=UPI0023B035F7|nr:hypothetical protein [Luteipulveratus sp. YIM 133132]MDE9364815.1 hypothetical protein [Luteipulveratus sp. YIM 133132]
MTLRRWIALAVLLVGLTAMAWAAAWAPQQPEFLQNGGACELAPCGELTDPPRWHAAWLLWAPGALLAVAGAVGGARPMRPLGRKAGVAIAVASPFYLIALLEVAVAVSLFTSAHGAATVGVAGAAVPFAYYVTSHLLDLPRGRRTKVSAVR